MSKIIGIDLGTTNSAFAYMVAGKPEVITNADSASACYQPKEYNLRY